MNHKQRESELNAQCERQTFSVQLPSTTTAKIWKNPKISESRQAS